MYNYYPKDREKERNIFSQSHLPSSGDDDLTPSSEVPPYPGKMPETKRRSFKFWGKKIALIFGILLVIGGIFFAYKIFSAGEKVFLGKKDHSLITQIKKLILPEKNTPEIETKERVNILLIGIRGTEQNKDQGGGIYLADTIIVLSMKPNTKEVAMLSIPRDLWVNLDNYGEAKINAAYAYGLRDDKKEGGAHLLTSAVEKVTGLPLDYYVVIDFAGFEKAIDIIGGIDVNVEQAFTDYFYPAWNYEYQTISFSAGPQHMNGDRALKFVRSRHGGNGEGSDFARARRQQKILVAAKDKIFSLSTILNPLKITGLIDSMGNHMLTNLELSEAREFIQITREVNPDQIANRVLENGNGGMLVATTSEGGASILVPAAGDFSEIQKLAQNIFNPESGGSGKETVKSKRKTEEKIKVQVRNGTATEGLAGKAAVELQEEGYEIVGIFNADSQDYDKTVIFDYTEGKQEKALENLRTKFDANVAAGRSFFLEQSPDGRGADADFVIVLGKDQKL